MNRTVWLALTNAFVLVFLFYLVFFVGIYWDADFKGD